MYMKTSSRVLLKGITVRLLLGLMVFSLVSSLFIMPLSVDAASGHSWTQCSIEGNDCDFTGTKEVRYGINSTSLYNFTTGIFTDGTECTTAAFAGVDPANGTVKNCYYRDLQLDSGAMTVDVSNLNKTVTVTFSVYAQQAGTAEDLKSKITVNKTSGGVFEALDEEDTVAVNSSTASFSQLVISFKESLVGADNAIRIDGGTFVDSLGTLYDLPVEISKIQFTGPAIAADTTDNYTVNDIEWTFVDNPLWRGAITEVLDGEDPLEEGTDYTISSGKITIKAGVLTKGNHTMVIQASGYPDTVVNQQLNMLYTGAGAGTQSNPYLIATADQLDQVRDHLENGTYFQLAADIDLSGYANWEPIGNDSDYFYGNMDGNGYTITNLNINGSGYSYKGLFGYVGNTGRLTNVKLNDASVTGFMFVGILVGLNTGIISYSEASGTVNGYYYGGGLVGSNQFGTINNSYASATVSGNYYIGGLVGYGFVSTISNSYATGAVNGYSYIGGLVGYSYYDTISNSYAIGAVSGSSTGGLVGISGGQPLTSNFYDKDTTHQFDEGKGVGKSTAEMLDQATFNGWSFTSDWYMLSGQYPQLWVSNALTQGTAGGTTKLKDAVVGMEYSVDGGATYTPIEDTEVDNIAVNAGDQMKVRVVANPSHEKTWTVGLEHIKPASAPTTAALTTGTVGGTMKLTGVAAGMEYKLNNGVYTTITGLVVDNITAEAGDVITVRIAATAGQPASGSQTLTVQGSDINSNSANAALSSLTLSDVSFSEIFDRETINYTASVDNSVSSTTVSAETVDTEATITAEDLGSKALVIGDNTIKVHVTAEDGVTTQAYTVTVTRGSAKISSAAIAGVTAPVRGAAPVATLEDTEEYTAVITWSPAASTFAASTEYTATIIITPKYGYTLSGVNEDFFTVAGATTTNEADSGVITAVFPPTSAPIDTAAIAGVSAPVTGAVPVAALEETDEYTATIAWSPTATKFAASTAYTATITLTPKHGYTLSGVSESFFTVAGATTTNAADSGVITAVFPATAASSSGGSGGSTAPTDTTVISTNGTITLPVGNKGEVSLEDAVTVYIPVGAANKELKITIEKWLETQPLLTNKEVLASPVFEILKNFTENFSKAVTLTFAFDAKSLKSNEKAAVFYYDEVNKIWVEVKGGKTVGNHITVEVNHFTKYAVLVVDAVTGLPVTETSTEVSFSDIAGHWAEASIKQAVISGIVKGYADSTFRPNVTVTRAEFAVMLINALKLQGEGAVLSFTDSDKLGAWAQNAVAQAVEAGIINGYEDGSFRPNKEITRAEMAVIIAKALGHADAASAAAGFADDKDIPAWAKGSVAYVKEAGIVRGNSSNKFNPQAHATRAEAVTVLLNMLVQEKA